MKLPMTSKKRDDAAPPLALDAQRARLAEVQTYLDGLRLITPYSNDLLLHLLAEGDYQAVDTARQQLKEGATTERAALEIERCQLTMQIAAADEQAALAARRAVQAQIDATLLQRSALSRQLLDLREDEHRAARQSTDAAAWGAAAARDLEDWTDYLVGSTPEQRWRRRGNTGRYLGVAAPPLEAPDRRQDWHGPPIKDGITFEPQYSAERKRQAWALSHPAPDAPAS